MGQSRLKRLDKFSVGMIWGIILPFIVFLFIYLIRYGSIPIIQFVIHLSEMKILIKILSLCGFSNLLVFLYFYRKGLDQAAKGVIAATFIYGFLVLVSRFI
jgi:hypothetical protein